jgi:hypothetical protein
VFNARCQQAFRELKRQLVTAPLLSHFDLNWATQLETDASDSVIASVLSQRQSNGEWHLVAYYSKTMIDAELNYLVYNKEMLAIVFSLQH